MKKISTSSFEEELEYLAVTEWNWQEQMQKKSSSLEEELQ